MKWIKIIKNFFFCLKYPFYKSYNRFTGKFCGYSFTEYDQIDYGWQKAFGRQMSEEIKRVGLKYKRSTSKHIKWKDIIRWYDIKEKYGSLVLCANHIPELGDVLAKYELLSMCYCRYCGKPTRYITGGWVNYLCEECTKKVCEYNELKLSGKDYRRLTKSDKPVICKLNSEGNFVEVDLSAKYGINFEDLWELKND